MLSNSSPKSKVQTSVLGLGVDFVYPLSQQEGQQEGDGLEGLDLTHILCMGFWLSLRGEESNLKSKTTLK